MGGEGLPLQPKLNAPLSKLHGKHHGDRKLPIVSQFL
jgi:hypothetical protein